ncbi:MAG: N-acetyltransferase [Phycisphaerales bacterium]|nr:N-acetyltransferase [Phycisphaerales bacterium]
MITIRDERPDDADAIRRVILDAFPTADEADLVDALRADGQLVSSLVAVLDGAIVGHAALSPVTVTGAERGVGLAPVAVATACQGRGVGAALVSGALDAARTRGAAFVVVLGAPAYYDRFGFGPASTWDLHDEFGGGDAFQVCAFEPDVLRRGSGAVRYAPAFDRFTTG